MRRGRVLNVIESAAVTRFKSDARKRVGYTVSRLLKLVSDPALPEELSRARSGVWKTTQRELERLVPPLAMDLGSFSKRGPGRGVRRTRRPLRESDLVIGYGMWSRLAVDV